MRAGFHSSLSVAVAFITMLGSPADAEQIVGLVTNNSLIVFDSASPGSTSSPVAITGLASGDVLHGIDFRPATGQLHLLGSDRIYTVNPSTGAATQVGSNGAFSLGGNLVGFDVNPVVDRLRLVTGGGSNLRVNPNDGTLIVDTSVFYDNTTADGDPIDPNAGATPTIAGLAYSNNVANALSTILFGIDTGLDILVTLNPPNAGVLDTLGPLGVNASGELGFDISGATGLAYAALAVGGSSSSLFQINLATGAATLVGGIGGGQVVLTGLTVVPGAATPVPEPATLALLGVAFGAAGWITRHRGR
jgi:hypothetical protein